MSAAWLVFGLLACEGDKEGEDTSAVYDVPALVHTAPTVSLTEGDAVTLEVAATDPDGVSEVSLYWRTEGDSVWDSVAMEPGASDTWTATVSGVESPAFEYYFRATDDGDPPLSAFDPAAAEDAPYALAVQVDALPLPFAEDFEPTGTEVSLLDLGWWAPSLGFPAYPWDLGEPGYDSNTAAVHLRGVEGVSEMADWLITPALDFTTLESVMVTWVESGNASDLASHGLYVSTTTRDPADGGFVPVIDALTNAPEDQWGRSAAIDLTAWAGEPVVYLAWYYQGSYADDWSIDDVSVRALAPDLDASLTWSPDPVHPGETAEITVTLTNLVDASAEGLTATLSLPDGGGTVLGDAVAVGDIDAYGTAEVRFELALDGDLRDNRPLALDLEVSNDADLWIFDELEMIVGYASTARVDLELDSAANVSVLVGVGDPDAPTHSFTLYSGSVAAGFSTITQDITELYELLPPAAGELRWFTEVTSSSDGRIEDFILEYGDESYEATTIPPLNADEMTRVWLPEPPDPALYDSSTSPDPVQPGDSGVVWTLSLRNEGEDTSGPVTGTLTALDADVTVHGGESLSIDPDVWTSREIRTLAGLTVDVSPDHDSSRPARFELALSDGLESWTLDLDIDVPWPVLRIVEIEVDDDDRDGMLEAGEDADLAIHVANTGDLDTFGALDAVLSIHSSSTADASITSGGAEYQSIGVDASRDEDFALTVHDGVAGDTIDLVLTLDDGTASYEATATLTLGEPAWTYLSSAEDEIDDPLDDYGFDVVRGAWRVVGDELQLVIASETVYDPDDMFIEMWGQSTGADYLYYRILYQYGTGYLQGYNSGDGFRTIGDLSLDMRSETEILLTWDTADMGLLLDELEIGIAAGWCGPPEYYCDQYPDDWGYPYDSFTTAEWFSMKW